MLTRLRKTAATCGLVTLAVLTLTGCIRQDVTANVTEDDRVSGSISTSIDLAAIKNAMSSMGGQASAQSDMDIPDAAELAEANAQLNTMLDESIIGDLDVTGTVTVTGDLMKISLDYAQVPFVRYSQLTQALEDALASSSEGQQAPPTAGVELRFGGDDQIQQVTGHIGAAQPVTDGAQAGTDMAGMAALTDGMLTTTVTVTFPGEVYEHNGDLIDLHTVTWTGNGTSVTPVQAAAHRTGVTVDKLWIIAGGFAVLAVLAALVLRRIGAQHSRDAQEDHEPEPTGWEVWLAQQQAQGQTIEEPKPYLTVDQLETQKAHSHDQGEHPEADRSAPAEPALELSTVSPTIDVAVDTPASAPALTGAEADPEPVTEPFPDAAEAAGTDDVAVEAAADEHALQGPAAAGDMPTTAPTFPTPEPSSPTPTASDIARAHAHPSQWLHAYDPAWGDNPPAQAIMGAWWVDSSGTITNTWTPNPHYQKKT